MSRAVYGQSNIQGVTYESLSDPGFMRVASKAIPFLEALHDEFDCLTPGPPTTGRLRLNICFRWNTIYAVR